jgi:hypothetical protein
MPYFAQARTRGNCEAWISGVIGCSELTGVSTAASRRTGAVDKVSKTRRLRRDSVAGTSASETDSSVTGRFDLKTASVAGALSRSPRDHRLTERLICRGHL